MSVYQPLEKYLTKQALGEVPMSFAEVATVLGRALPRSAYSHRPWWANEAAGHSHAKAWLNAGFETAQVDMGGQKLVFRRISPRALQENSRMFEHSKVHKPQPLFGALKGTFTIEPGWDLTKPALEGEAPDIDKTADLIDSGLRGLT